MENRMDELPCLAPESTSTKNQIASWSGGSTEEITERQSMKNDIVIDVPGHDEVVLPCFDETFKAENDQKILWEMINGGIGRVNTDHDDQWWYGNTPCIYKVEPNLRKVHEQSTFHPKLVSIGPFHHNISADHLKPMEQHKWRSLSNFLKSTNPTRGRGSGSDSTTTTDDDTIMMTEKKQCLVASMQKLEAKARACYSEKFDDLGSNEFVMMMVLDGCFIIQLLLGFRRWLEENRNEADSLFSWRSRLPNIRHDLLLLENQLPFIVLQKIFTMSGKYRRDKRYLLENQLIDLIFDFFNPVLPREKKVLDHCKKANLRLPHCHLLQVFRSSFGQEQEQENFNWYFWNCASYHPEYLPNDGLDQDMSIHCVTKLREAGVEFKKRDHHDLLDIEFKNGRLHIPPLFIDGNTVPVLLNFIAYEQRQHLITPYFTSYLMFLDYLVNSSKDVEHLHYKGIINHGLGSDEQVAFLFNKLCNEVVLELGDNNFLSPVFKEVNKYFGKRRNRWRAA